MNIFQTVLAIWGAILSTILAIVELRKRLTDKPRIVVDAGFVWHPEGGTQGKGTTVVRNDRTQEVLLAVAAANKGQQPLQIMACAVEDEHGTLYQVLPEGLPTVLEPNSQVKVEIQKEWIDRIPVKQFGFLDALGRVHSVGRHQLTHLVAASNTMPTNRKDLRNKKTGELVNAFQAKDKALVTPSDERVRLSRARLLLRRLTRQ